MSGLPNRSTREQLNPKSSFCKKAQLDLNHLMPALQLASYDDENHFYTQAALINRSTCSLPIDSMQISRTIQKEISFFLSAQKSTVPASLKRHARRDLISVILPERPLQPASPSKKLISCPSFCKDTYSIEL